MGLTCEAVLIDELAGSILARLDEEATTAAAATTATTSVVSSPRRHRVPLAVRVPVAMAQLLLLLLLPGLVGCEFGETRALRHQQILRGAQTAGVELSLRVAQLR